MSSKKSKKTLFEPLQSLPTYNGGKRRLLPWTFGHLSKVSPPQQWKQLCFADAFMGGGSISLFAKAQGFGNLLANDWSDRSTIIQKALLLNQDTRLSQTDVARLILKPDTQISSFIERAFGGNVFSCLHARLLDQIGHNLTCWQEPTKREMARLLQWRIVERMVTFPTSIGTSNRPYAEILDGKRPWWLENPKRFQDGSFERLLNPIYGQMQQLAERINQGVFAATGPVCCTQMDAFQFVPGCSADILYLDPPYPGTTDYESSNRVLDAILTGQTPESSSDVSPFSKGTTALSDLLSCCKHIPVWVIAYGNKEIDLDGLISLVKKARRTHTVQGWQKSYRHFAHVSKRKDNQELLVIAVANSFQST